MAWSRAFKKCYCYVMLCYVIVIVIVIFWTNFFCKYFYNITRFCDKKFNFCKFAIFFADSKRRAQVLSNDLSLVIFGHQTWDLEGGGQMTPPCTISWFSSIPAEIGLRDSK